MFDISNKVKEKLISSGGVSYRVNRSTFNNLLMKSKFNFINNNNYRLESRIETAIKLNRIPKAKFKGIATSIRSTASLPDDIISLITSEVKYRKAEGEADVAISTMDFDSIVISGDSDILFSTGPNYVAIPVRQGKEFVFIVII